MIASIWLWVAFLLLRQNKSSHPLGESFLHAFRKIPDSSHPGGLRGSPSGQNKEKCRDAEKVIDKKELRGYNGVVSARVLEW